MWMVKGFLYKCGEMFNMIEVARTVQAKNKNTWMICNAQSTGTLPIDWLKVNHCILLLAIPIGQLAMRYANEVCCLLFLIGCFTVAYWLFGSHLAVFDNKDWRCLWN